MPVPVQLRMIDPSALRLDGTIAGRPFSLDGPDRNGRWIVGTNVPGGVPLPTTLVWTRSDGLELAALETELPAVTRDGPLRIGASGYATTGTRFDADEDGAWNVDELRCGSDPRDRSSAPDASGDCESSGPPAGDALARLRADGRFGLFVAAIEATGRQGALAGPATVFAPTDAAFSASYAPGDYSDGVRDDGVALGLLVDRHIVGGVVFDGSQASISIEGRAVTMNDGSAADLESTTPGEITVAARSDGGSVRTAAGLDALDLDGIPDVALYAVDALLSIDHDVAIDYGLSDAPPESFPEQCFTGLNAIELPSGDSAFTYAFTEETLPTVRSDVTLTERARITVTHLGGTPSDTGAALYDTDLALVAADDDGGPGTFFALESTVLEPGRYCLTYGHYLATPVPPEGWSGTIRIVTTPTGGSS